MECFNHYAQKSTARLVTIAQFRHILSATPLVVPSAQDGPDW